MLSLQIMEGKTVKTDRTKYRRALICPHGVEKGRACWYCRLSDVGDSASTAARALAFYANPRSWDTNAEGTHRLVKHRRPGLTTPAELDEGRRARMALRRLRAHVGTGKP